MNAEGVVAGLAASLPWWLATAILLVRWRRACALDAFDPRPRLPVPRLSVIVPARNEARVIERCVRSILASRYPALDVIVVDDHSTDGTGDRARRAAAGDDRVTVLVPPALPAGWFGKQWACWHGARAARGDLLLFTDADTAHGPELHGRAVRALQDLAADLVSVLGAQELVGFWEKVVQPQVFAMLFARYGGTEQINRSRRVTDKIAAGQFLLVTRRAYDATGGHEAVRGRAAEDLALAQRFFALGYRTWIGRGDAHLSVRMYTSLREIVRGWTKNLYAAGRDAVPLPAGRGVALALLLPLPPLLTLLPVATLAGGALAAALGPVVFGASASLALAAWFAAVYRSVGLALPWVLTAPLGALVVLAIALLAIARGRRVRWKDRLYDVEGSDVGA